MVEVLTCPVCGSASLSPHLTCIDHALTKEKFTLKKCSGCSLLITSPRPEDANLLRYYQFADYISHSGKSRSTITTRLYRLAQTITLRWKRNLIQQEFKTGRILDVGCGAGIFLNAMKRKGWEINGTEPSAIARENAERLLQQPVFQSLEVLPEKKFDVITLWHVLEHIADLPVTMQQIKRLLKPGGVLYIGLPNYNSFDAQKYGAYWAGYDVPRHLWHFNTQSMTAFLKKQDYTLIRMVPMKLDAFYVSLLSAHYLHPNRGFKNYISAFATGIISNLKASTQLNYSSLIFIARANQGQ